MKLFLLIAVIASVINVQILAKRITDQDRLDAISKCKKQSGVKDKVLEEAQEGNFKNDPALKKQTKCFFEEIGVLKGNDINDELLENYVEIVLPDKKDQAKQIAQECSKKKQDKPEETSFEMGKCVLEKKKE